MTATLGFLTVGRFLALTLWTRASVLVCLVLVPIVFALIGGHGGAAGRASSAKGCSRSRPSPS